MPQQSSYWMLPLLVLSLLVVPAVATAQNFHANLTGLQEVPAVSTVARGQFDATIAPDEQSIQYTLTYRRLQGNVQQAHIHIAQRSVNGSIVIWLCGTGAPGTVLAGPAGTPTCPQSGTVSRTVFASDVVAGSQAAQQLAAGELDEVIGLIRAGVGYANVHTDLSASGEIRGQIRAVE